MAPPLGRYLNLESTLGTQLHFAHIAPLSQVFLYLMGPLEVIPPTLIWPKNRFFRAENSKIDFWHREIGSYFHESAQ